MENPCLTFVTPTLLAGDRSLVTVVAHEIAHSWMGNLVTNATWGDFWMNEGFTVFVERKIIEKLHGQKLTSLKSEMGWKELQASIDRYGEAHEFTKLRINLHDVDPDDSFSKVPYEKGYAFLRYLEDLVGGPSKFAPFIRAHVQRFQFGTVSAEAWKDFFICYFKNNKTASAAIKSIDWESWFNAPGMPISKCREDASLIDEAVQVAESWACLSFNGGSKLQQAKLIYDQELIMLSHLISLQSEGKQTISVEILSAMDDQYRFSKSKNAEIRFLWYSLGLRCNDTRVFEPTVQFLKEQGRMKFVRPLYRDMYKYGREDGKKLAVKTFEETKSLYHGIAAKMIARDLGLV